MYLYMMYESADIKESITQGKQHKIKNKYILYWIFLCYN